MPNHYELLNLNQEVLRKMRSNDEVQAAVQEAYKLAVAKQKALIVQTPQLSQINPNILRELEAARDILADQAKRKAYDETLNTVELARSPKGNSQYAEAFAPLDEIQNEATRFFNEHNIKGYSFERRTDPDGTQVLVLRCQNAQDIQAVTQHLADLGMIARPKQIAERAPQSPRPTAPTGRANKHQDDELAQSTPPARPRA